VKNRISPNSVPSVIAALVAVALASMAFASAADATPVTFTNSTPITVSSSGANNGTPYPSSMVVSGVTGTVYDVNVSLNGFSHTFPDDLGVVLVAPSGAAIELMDGVGNDPDASSLTFTFDDGATSNLPDGDVVLTSGTYKPTAYYINDSFPAPGPLLAYGTPAPKGAATLNGTFGGTAPNGTWNLFVRDFVSGDGGSFAGGWGLTIDNVPPPPPTLTATAPASPANENNPKVLGSAIAGSTVRLYAAGDCSGPVIVEGPAAELASPGLTVAVPDNSTTTFTAGLAGASVCSAPIAYVESTPGPPKASAAPPPETTLTEAKIKGRAHKATFAFSGSGGSGALSFECALDKGAFTPCTSPQTYKKLKPGKHKFQVRAKSAAGTVDPTPASKEFQVPKPGHKKAKPKHKAAS
jgi:subtilisin-like proprotein convertase family protein